MLPRQHRLTSSRSFSHTVRRGRRLRSGLLVAHVDHQASDTPPQLGLILAKAVGNSVQRHRIARVVRHAAWPGLASLPPGTIVVIRALPGAADATNLAESTGTLLSRVAAGPSELR